MKKIILFSAAILMGIMGCTEQSEEITDPAYARLFAPTNLKADVQNVVNVTLTWEKVENADNYNVEIYKTAAPDNIVRSEADIKEPACTFTGLDEDVEYGARVQATSAKIPVSNWTVVTFATTPPPPPETIEWNFSDDEFANITEGDFKQTETVRGLSVAGGTGGVRRTTNAVTIDEYSFTYRLDLRGSGTWNSDLANCNRLIRFKAEKPCVVTVYANSGTAGRTLKITDKNNNTLGEYLTTGSIGKVDVNVTEASDINIYSGGSGIEVYLVKMVIGGSYEPDHTSTLRSLAVTGETLTPAFNADITEYEVNVAKSVTEVTITSGKNHPNQTIEGDGKQTVTANTVVFPVRVTAEDGVAQTTYNITVNRAEIASSDATLKSFTISPGELDPAFDPNVTSYTGTVPYSTESVTITATANHKFAKVGNNGTIVADNLIVGNNGPYAIVVLAEDLSVKTYSITVVREPEPVEPPTGENKWWNFSDAAFTGTIPIGSNSITTEYTIDGLTIIASTGKQMSLTTSGKSLDGYSFTHRLQLVGTGSITERVLKFDVTGLCTITVYMVTGSGSTERPLIVHNGTEELVRLTTAGSDIDKYTYNYTGAAGSIYLYSGNSGINLYGLKVDY